MAQNALEMGCLANGLAGVCKASNTDVGVIAAVEIYKRTATNPMKREEFPHRKARIRGKSPGTMRARTVAVSIAAL